MNWSSRTTWVMGLCLAAGLVPLLRSMAPELISLHRDDAFLRIGAPNLHFLEGRSVERLHDGASLIFSLQLTLSPDRFQTVSRRQIDRFVVSFDLWEEKFSITRIGGEKLHAPNLSREATERWMFDHTGITLQGVPDDRPNWLRLDLRADDTRDSTSPVLEPSVTLSRLIEWFGRPQRGEAQRWQLDRGPFRIADLQR